MCRNVPVAKSPPRKAGIFAIIPASREAAGEYPLSEANCEAAARAVRGVIVRETGFLAAIHIRGERSRHH